MLFLVCQCEWLLAVCAYELVFAFLLWALYSHRLVAERTDAGEYVLFLFHDVSLCVCLTNRAYLIIDVVFGKWSAALRACYDFLHSCGVVSQGGILVDVQIDEGAE